MVMSQLSGVNAALFYAYDIFNSSTSSLDSLVSTAVLYSILVIWWFLFLNNKMMAIFNIKYF